MLEFSLWLNEQEKTIKPGAVKVSVPQVRQQTNYSCGAAALKAICGYFGVGPHKEEDYIKLLGTNSKDGTWYDSIVKKARDFGLKVVPKEHMTLAELKSLLDQKVPVLCCIQAWGDPKTYPKLKSGHYVVAVGYDRKQVFFEDPSVDNGKRAYIPWDEFDRRWADSDGKAGEIIHLGIAMWKPGANPRRHLRQAAEIE